MSERTYSITELAREFDITTRTIRFYEDKGLLSPKRDGQTRIYSAQNRVTLKLIVRGKRLGFSLKESEELIQLYNPQEGNVTQLNRMLEKIAEKRAQLEQQMHDIEITQIELNEAEQKCRSTLHESIQQPDSSSNN